MSKTNYKTKIMICGGKSTGVYGAAFYKAFKDVGYKDVIHFPTNDVLENCCIGFNFLKRFEAKYLIGLGNVRVNRKARDIFDDFEPNLVFVYTDRILTPETIVYFKKDSKVFIYNNDNAFGEYYPRFFWKNYRNSLKLADIVYVYRKSDINNCIDYGAEKVSLLRSYYIEEQNFPDVQYKLEEEIADVVFLGHFEKDHRISLIKKIIDSDIKLAIPKTTMKKMKNKSRYLVPIEKTYGAVYNAILSQAKIALCILSTINHDTYTRRCFEIPAAGTMMLSEYTDDLASMFEEDKEIVFFRSKEELVDKIKYYLSHDEEREQIAKAGRERVLKDGHEVKDRVMQVMKEYYKLVNEEE